MHYCLQAPPEDDAIFDLGPGKKTKNSLGIEEENVTSGDNREDEVYYTPVEEYVVKKIMI